MRKPREPASVCGSAHSHRRNRVEIVSGCAVIQLSSFRRQPRPACDLARLGKGGIREVHRAIGARAGKIFVAQSVSEPSKQAMAHLNLEPLFTPFAIKGITLPNRFVMPGMQRQWCDNGVP